MMKSRRLFVGIPVSDEIKENLIHLINSLQELDVDLKLVLPEYLHFTIKFLGDVEGSKIDEIKEKLKRIKREKFNISLKGIGSFPSLERINVIWVAVKNAEKFIPLMQQVNKNLDYIRKNEYGEVPHLTIARVKTGRNKELLQEWLREHREDNFGEMEVGKIVLYESQLTPNGPIYLELETISLLNENSKANFRNL